MSTHASPYFERCTFYNNEATARGGALAAFEATPMVYNCTFYANASNEGGAICFWLGYMDIVSTIIAGSTTGESMLVGPDGYVNLACCDFFGNAGGDWVAPFDSQLGVAGNICEDPIFCTTTGPELTIRDDSPCAPFDPSHPQCDLVGAWPVNCSGAGVVDASSVLRPALRAARPNPSAGMTKLELIVPAAFAGTSGSAGIHDATGRCVRVLASGPWRAGINQLDWDGCDEAGRPLPSGVYYVRASCGALAATQRIMRLQ